METCIYIHATHEDEYGFGLEEPLHNPWVCPVYLTNLRTPFFVTLWYIASGTGFSHAFSKASDGVKWCKVVRDFFDRSIMSTDVHRFSFIPSPWWFYEQVQTKDVEEYAQTCHKQLYVVLSVWGFGLCVPILNGVHAIWISLEKQGRIQPYGNRPKQTTNQLRCADASTCLD